MQVPLGFEFDFDHSCESASNAAVILIPFAIFPTMVAIRPSKLSHTVSTMDAIKNRIIEISKGHGGSF